MRYGWSFWACVLPGLFGALVMSSCGGEEFTSNQAVAGSAAGGASDTGGVPGAGGQGAAPNAGSGSIITEGGSFNGGAGTFGNGEAGNAVNGDAGAGNAMSHCTALEGMEFKGHCYVDATILSTSQAQAAATCEERSLDGKVSGHLLVLDSVEEQNFILEQFMVPFTDVSDAWLGLTCSELAHPDINGCYCMGCTKAELAEKQRAWAWLREASSTFGWINGNPNGGFRCAALAYNPDLTVWGWVDRPCDKASVTSLPGHPHAYRTLCEFEP